MTGPDPIDPELTWVTACHGGDRAAFAWLFRRHRDTVTAYCWRMLRHREEAEEACVETFARILRRPCTPGRPFRTYALSIAHRLCIDVLRRRQTRLRLLPLVRTSAVDGHTPEQAAERASRRRRLEEALGGLSPEHRSSVLMFYREDLPTQEIARIQGCSDQQVRSRLSYARKRLRTLLEDPP